MSKTEKKTTRNRESIWANKWQTM